MLIWLFFYQISKFIWLCSQNESESDGARLNNNTSDRQTQVKNDDVDCSKANALLKNELDVHIY